MMCRAIVVSVALLAGLFCLSETDAPKSAHAQVGALAGYGPLIFAACSSSHTTWNPSNIGGGMTLSNGNLTVTGAGQPGTAESIHSFTFGKWYWEVADTTDSNSATFGGGLVNGSANLGTYPGNDPNGWGYYGNNGNLYHNGNTGSPGTTYGAGAVISTAFDASAGNLWFAKNGTWLSGNPSLGTSPSFSGLTSGPYYAASGSGGSGTRVYTTNFGASAFTYTMPTGFCGP